MPSMGVIAVTTAVTNQLATPITGLGKINGLSLIGKITVTSGGTTANIYVQTSLDAGATWYDVKSFSFTTATAVKGACIDATSQQASLALTTGSLTADTAVAGVLGDQLRFAVTTTGTYGAGSSLEVQYQTR